MAASGSKAKIAVIGAGWWSQGWHLPHLERNEGSEIAAIVDINPNPKSNLNPNLVSLAALGETYNVPIFSSAKDMLATFGSELDGVLIATNHSTHYAMGDLFLEEATKRHNRGEKPLNILMEKPMTTDVYESKKLYDLVRQYRELGGKGCFLLNHTANYRAQVKKARELVVQGEIGEIRHVSAFFASPLMWLFGDPANTGWNEPQGNMLGNGFGWGQSSHLLAWIFHVCPDLVPERVFCAMNHSETTGADVAHSATITCHRNHNSLDSVGDVVVSISGTCLLPGDAHSEESIGKQVKISIFGTQGAILYCGDDQAHDSGNLEVRLYSKQGKVEYPSGDGFDFENYDPEGTGPESIQSFIDACRGDPGYYVGADALLGLRTVQILDAMYRSNDSRRCEDILFRKVSPEENPDTAKIQ